MKKFARDASVAGVLYGVFMGILFALSLYLNLGASVCFRYHCLTFGLLLGTGSGVLFGVCMATTLLYRSRKVLIELRERKPRTVGEDLLRQGEANHYVLPSDWKVVGGYLYLTSERLYFRSHRSARRFCEFSIPTEKITAARSYRTAKLFPTGLEIETLDQDQYFVVKEPHLWVQKIKQAKDRSGDKHD